MSFSVNETQMLAQKAARGAGAHPAQAAHFGRAAVCHLAAGRDPGDLLAALDALPEGPIQTLPFAPDRSALGQSYAEAGAAPEARPTLPARVHLPEALKARMDVLAWQTYVPATEASRTGGAGAGLTDTD